MLGEGTAVIRTTGQQFQRSGFVVTDALLTRDDLQQLSAHLPAVSSSGTRTLLNDAVFRGLAQRLRADPALVAFLSGLVAVEGILFWKSRDRNWSLKPHRDSVIPISGDGPWKPAGRKEGMAFAHAPIAFLRRCIAVRLALDAVPEGDIRVEPGTHDSCERASPKTLVVPPGGVAVLRPSLVHSSTKLTDSPRRRVVHLLYAPRTLPGNYLWYHAV
ncbi:MAG: hypothetical protein AAGC71_14115 [Pseudomonadota bacterium]